MVSIFDRLKVIKDLILKKLDESLSRLALLASQSEIHLENEASLLRANIYIVQSLHEQGKVLRLQQAELLNRLEKLLEHNQIHQNNQESLFPESGSIARDLEAQGQLLQSQSTRLPRCSLLPSRVVDSHGSPLFALLSHLYARLPRRTVCLAAEESDLRNLLSGLGFIVDLWATAEHVPASEDLLYLNDASNRLPIIRHIDERACPIILSAFTATDLLDQIKELRGRGYHWHLVLYCDPSNQQTTFYCNHPEAIPDTEGHVLFFREFDLFSWALQWCNAVLHATHFR